MPAEQRVQANTERCDLYFMLYPGPVVRAQAAALARRLRSRGGLTGPLMAEPRLHISLSGLGSWQGAPTRLIARAKAAASRVRARPFRVELNWVEHWRGPVVARGDEGVIGVECLYGSIHEALVEEGLPVGEARRFVPHLTLLRDPRGIPGEIIRPLSWAVNEFLLIGSAYGQGRHEIFGRWPLHG